MAARAAPARAAGRGAAVRDVRGAPRPRDRWHASAGRGRAIARDRPAARGLAAGIALTLYARYRGRNEALAQAEAFADVLQRELGSGPERETQDLVERIRAGEIAAATPPPTPPVRQDELAAEAGLVPAAARPGPGALARHCGGARRRRARGRRNVRADPPAPRLSTHPSRWRRPSRRGLRSRTTGDRRHPPARRGETGCSRASCRSRSCRSPLSATRAHRRS